LINVQSIGFREVVGILSADFFDKDHFQKSAAFNWLIPPRSYGGFLRNLSLEADIIWLRANISVTVIRVSVKPDTFGPP
jgi:hypothetical protein